MKRLLPILAVTIATAPFALSADKPSATSTKPAEPALEFPPAPPVLARTPAEELKTIQLQPGYHFEIVVSDPSIAEPTMIAFDGDGRMFVVEMRTYMQDIDGTGEHDPVSRVSVHWSSKGDGTYDQHKVFADNLLLPRMILPLDKGRVLIGETDTSDVMLHTDTDGDGVADKKEPWFVGGPRGGNMEHQPNGLQWGMDNWLYSTYNAYRLRWNGATGEIPKEPTAANGGQWGVGQDDFGKIWFVNAGGERGPVNFQTGIVYGAFNTKDQFATDFDKVWPLVGLGDVQGGPNRYRPEDKTLNHFTATCGSEIYRGDKMPELKGDLIFGEPVGRLIRRAKVEVQDGLTRLSNPYGQSEFIRSTDPLFRPINMATAPDGSLYIVDMYRGIIQEGNWVKEGSYLRKSVQQHALDKPVGHGRIWRLVHDSAKPGPQPKMNAETPAQLVAHLEHPNGWWRDTAQKLLVVKQDKSVIPALTAMARDHKNPLARLHALWTLEGLDAATPELIRAKLKDEHPQLRAGAIRVSETLYKKGDKSLATDITTASQDKDQSVAMQAFLTAKLLNFPDWKKSLELAAHTPNLGILREIGGQILHPPAQIATKDFKPAELKLYKAGETTFQTLCAACHGMDGRGMPMIGAAPGTMLAPSFFESKTIRGSRDGSILVLLHGLSGDIDGRKYEGQMVSMATNDDTWIAGVLSYVRKSFGGGASFVTPEQVKALRGATKDRTAAWTISELRSVLPQPLPNSKEWKLTASDKPDGCESAIDGKPDTRYTSGRPQAPGMWFQIELPQETEITGIELDNMKSPGDYPRGYKVEVSADGTTWSKPIATGAGNSPVTDIEFPATKAKFIRITQTGEAKGTYWSIHELEVFGPKPAAKVASAH